MVTVGFNEIHGQNKLIINLFCLLFIYMIYGVTADIELFSAFRIFSVTEQVVELEKSVTTVCPISRLDDYSTLNHSYTV